MGRSEIVRYNHCLDRMTGLPISKREEYMQWLARQNEAVMVMIGSKMSKRHYIQSKKYYHSSCSEAIFMAAMIETISIYCEADKDIGDISFDLFWFEKSHVINVRRTLEKYRHNGDGNEN